MRKDSRKAHSQNLTTRRADLDVERFEICLCDQKHEWHWDGPCPRKPGVTKHYLLDENGRTVRICQKCWDGTPENRRIY